MPKDTPGQVKLSLKPESQNGKIMEAPKQMQTFKHTKGYLLENTYPACSRPTYHGWKRCNVFKYNINTTKRHNNVFDYKGVNQ